jgi:hypothetical protein
MNTQEPGKSQKYELALMADEALDVSDRLLLMMRSMTVPFPPGA